MDKPTVNSIKAFSAARLGGGATGVAYFTPPHFLTLVYTLGLSRDGSLSLSATPLIARSAPPLPFVHISNLYNSF